MWCRSVKSYDGFRALIWRPHSPDMTPTHSHALTTVWSFCDVDVCGVILVRMWYVIYVCCVDVGDLFDRTLSWRDVSWLKSITTLPVIIKGVLTAEDAQLGVQAGCDAIVVSNHGARQLDGVTQHNTVQHNTTQYNTIQYNTIQYNTIQYNTIQYNTIQYNTIQYNTYKQHATHNT